MNNVTGSKMGNNSFYDFYEKINDRCYVALCFPGSEKRVVKYIWEPLAKKVIITGFEDFDFFLFGKRRYYILYEGITGLPVLMQICFPSRIMRRCKAELFIDCAPAEIKKRGGNSFLNHLIVNFLVDYDHKISPKYRVKE